MGRGAGSDRKALRPRFGPAPKELVRRRHKHEDVFDQGQQRHRQQQREPDLFMPLRGRCVCQGYEQPGKRCPASERNWKQLVHAALAEVAFQMLQM